MKKPSTNRLSPWHEKVLGWLVPFDIMKESLRLIKYRLFGPENTPLLQVGYLGLVEVDTAYHVRLADLSDFQKTVSDRTWSAAQHYATDLKERNVKIAFFSATPQGGGVALMRHALLRFSHCLGTDIKWCVYSCV
jgi:hypothetical protein